MTFSSFEHIDVKMDGAASPYGTTPRDALAVKIADVRPDAAKRPNGMGSKYNLNVFRTTHKRYRKAYLFQNSIPNQSKSIPYPPGDGNSISHISTNRLL